MTSLVGEGVSSYAHAQPVQSQPHSASMNEPAVLDRGGGVCIWGGMEGTRVCLRIVGDSIIKPVVVLPL